MEAEQVIHFARRLPSSAAAATPRKGVATKSRRVGQMAIHNGSHAPSSVTLEYQLLRNTTSPDEHATGVRSYFANVAAAEVLKLDLAGNLRAYLAEYNPRKRNRVHDAIRRTIDMEPQRFITRNSGFAVAAADIEVDDNAKRMVLTDPTIINGAQSQGEIGRWLADTFGEDGAVANEVPFYVRLEVIVDPDPTEIVETAIARNTATPVKSISVAGKRGHLTELEASIQKRFPHISIRKNEAEENVEDTRRILQLARLLMPLSVSKSDSASEKLRAYKNPEQCLTDFSSWYEAKETDPDAATKYRFTIEIAPYAMEEYAYWESHDAWTGQYIWEETKKGRAARRGKNGKVVWVSPGLVFPIVGAMSEFVTNADGTWKISKPQHFKPNEMIARAVDQFRSVNSDPMQMGRSVGVYDALRIYPNTIIEVMRDITAATA